MSENTTEVLIGAAVFAVAFGFLIYMGQATGFSTGPSADSYDLNASFRSVEGITVGTDVRLAGVKIGTVTGLGLNAETFRVDAEFSIKNGIHLPDDSSIIIASEGLLGGNFVEIIPGGSLFNYGAGDEVEDTQSSVSLVSLLMKFVSGREE